MTEMESVYKEVKSGQVSSAFQKQLRMKFLLLLSLTQLSVRMSSNNIIFKQSIGNIKGLILALSDAFQIMCHYRSVTQCNGRVIYDEVWSC